MVMNVVRATEREQLGSFYSLTANNKMANFLKTQEYG